MDILENSNGLISQADILCETVDMPKLRVEYEKWYSQVYRIAISTIPERANELKNAYDDISKYLIEHLSYPGQGSRQFFQTRLQQQKGILIAALSASASQKNTLSSEKAVISIFDRFHIVVR